MFYCGCLKYGVMIDGRSIFGNVMLFNCRTILVENNAISQYSDILLMKPLAVIYI